MFKAIVDNLDGIDEKYHDLYEAKGDKFVMKAIEGLKPLAEFNVVHNALTKERGEHKTTKTKLASFGDLDPEATRVALERIPELELAAGGAIDEAKISGIVESRIAAKVKPVERERDLLKTQNAEKDGVIEGFKSKEKTRVITDTVTKAAKGLKLVDGAVEDAVVLAERLFEVGEDGAVVTRDNVGVTPGLTADAWLTDLAPRKPHWFGPSQGGGAGGGGNRGNLGPNPFTAEHWNMTEQGKLVTTDRPKAERLAKAAGTTIGGTKPAAKA